MSIKPIYIWTITALTIGIGIIPYKLPDYNPQINEPNKLLVHYQECTCCGAFGIEKGELEVPNQYKKYFPNKIYELTVPNNDEPYKFNLELLISSDFIISGKIIDIDTSEGKIQREDCGIKPVFEISKWAPTKYSANFWTFGPVFILIYFIGNFGLIIYSIICTANYKKK